MLIPNRSFSSLLHHFLNVLSFKYRVRDEQKPVCMLKLLSKINAVSAVSDCRSKGCSGDEASDHCKITVLVISGLQNRE